MVIQVIFPRPPSQGVTAGAAQQPGTAGRRGTVLRGGGPPGAREPKRNHGAAPCVLAALAAVPRLDLGGEGERAYSPLIPLLGVCLSAVFQEQHCRTDATPVWVRCCQTRPFPLPHQPSAKMKTENKTRKYMRNAFRDIKVPGDTPWYTQRHPVPCRMLLVSGDLHGAGRIASGPTGGTGVLSWGWRLGGIA